MANLNNMPESSCYTVFGLNEGDFRVIKQKFNYERNSGYVAHRSWLKYLYRHLAIRAGTRFYRHIRAK